MANSYPFVGKIPISGAMAIETSPYVTTNWGNDAATLPAQTPMAYKTTNWSEDDGDAEPQVRGFTARSDNWT